MERYADCVFCDDIRQEVGQKTSLMGIYSGMLYVEGYPTVLPKICMNVMFRTPFESPVTDLTIRVEQSGELLQEVSYGAEQLSELQQVHKVGLLDTKPGRLTIGAYIVLSPYIINEKSWLEVIILADGEEYKAGKLRIEKAPDEPE